MPLKHVWTVVELYVQLLDTTAPVGKAVCSEVTALEVLATMVLVSAAPTVWWTAVKRIQIVVVNVALVLMVVCALLMRTVSLIASAHGTAQALVCALLISMASWMLTRHV